MPRSDEKTQDAIALLKADHRAVEELFDEFESAKSDGEKLTLAKEICMQLTIHTMIEEELFYPGVEEETEEDIVNEAYVEHDGAKMLIAEILAGQPSDRFFEAKVMVLREEIKHHVNEEEKQGGMFSQAQKSNLDLDDLGARLAAMKTELQDTFSEQGLPTPTTRTMQGAAVNYGRPTA